MARRGVIRRGNVRYMGTGKVRYGKGEGSVWEGGRLGMGRGKVRYMGGGEEESYLFNGKEKLSVRIDNHLDTYCHSDL